MTRDEILQAIENMTVLELERTREGYGREVRRIRCCSRGIRSCSAAGGAELLWKKTEFDVITRRCGRQEDQRH